MTNEPESMDVADFLSGGGRFDPKDAEDIPRPKRAKPKTNGRAENTNGEWPEPTPLTEGTQPIFPLASLPEWLRVWVEAEAHSVQVSADMPALLALAMLSLACARRVRLHVRGDFIVPVNIYVAAAAAVSERKSPVFAAARAPIDSYERAHREKHAVEIGRAEDAIAIAKGKLNKAITAATKAENAQEVLATEHDVHHARDELETAERARRPALRLTAADITQEELARLLCEQGGRIAILDPEGIGPISIMLGRYAKQVNVDIYLKGHTGEQLSVDRVPSADGTSRSFTVERPALTVALTIQPHVFEKLAERKETRGLGLLARFLWCVPVSLVGRRRVDAPGMADEIRAGYESCLHELLELTADAEDQPHTLSMSTAAARVHQTFEAELEPNLGAGGQYKHFADWAGKLAGLVARLAALLHCADHRVEPWQVPISEDTMQRAIAIGRWGLAHAEYALEQVETADSAIPIAKQILELVSARRLETVDTRTLLRELRPRPSRDKLDEPLRLLCDHDFLREERAPAGGAVKKERILWRANPRLLAKVYSL